MSRKKEIWSARKELAWRKAVKDFGYGGPAHSWGRRRKAYIWIIEDSDEEPSGYATVRVGERWGERAAAVDEYLNAIAASPLEREREFSYQCPAPFSNHGWKIKMSEIKIFNREKLQFRIANKISSAGSLSTEFRDLLVKGSIRTHYVADTEKARESAWQTNLIALEYVYGELQRQCHQWINARSEMLKEAQMLDPLREGANQDEDKIIKDPLGRFWIWAELPQIPLSPLVWCTYILQPETRLADLQIGDVKPRLAFNQLSRLLNDLPIAAPAVATGARRIMV